MIVYDNSHQFKIIFKMTGSVLPGCLPVGCFTFCLGLALALYRHYDDTMDTLKNDPAPNQAQWIVNSFSIQTIAVVIGYLLVVRTNMALGRWMDGISEIQLMLSKWGDAFDALNGFFAGRGATATPEQRERIVNFRIRVAHWFSLMSCLAFATLRMSGEGEVVSAEEWLDQVPIKEMFGDDPTLKKTKSFTTNRSESDDLAKGVLDLQKSEKKGGKKEKELIQDLALLVLAEPTEEEVRLLKMANDKVNTICLWIIQGVILMVRKKLLDIPPPIVSRIFQELSNGMLGFNQAHKVAMVPFPFPFAQMVSLLLCMTYLAIPLYADLFTQNVVFTPIVSFVLPVVFAALNKIAIELEEPFGLDYNDVDIEVRHEDFLWLLVDVLRAPKQPPSYPDNQHEIEIWRGVFREALYVADEFEEYKPNRGKSEADMEADRSFALQSRDDSRDKATE
mmetsp:Transcript_33/g.82  ORF Transcript_33/g.82 Transcript_33/m.82 type:complete len:449 (+) Transcript_33:195-1541(+)